MRQSRTSGRGSMSGTTATRTIAASVACGRLLSTGPRKSATRIARTAVVSPASCDASPARWFTALCEKPPAEGIPLKNGADRVHGARREQLPVAVDPFLAGLPDAARDGRGLQERHDRRSRSAPPTSPVKLLEGRQRGRGRARSAPARSGRSPRCPAPRPNAISRIDPTTTMSCPGIRGSEPRHEHEHHDDATDSSRVGTLVCGIASIVAASDRKNPCPVKLLSTPSSFGSCPTATVAPTPILTPVSVDSLMYSTSDPSLSSRETTSMTPTSRVRAGEIAAARHPNRPRPPPSRRSSP